MAVDLGYDEGGCGDTLLVSLQMGVTQKAKKFKKSWKADLLESGIPFFHSVDYDNFDDGIFRGMSHDTRKLLLASLTGHLRKRMLFGMTAKVTVSLYNSKTDSNLRSQWGTAYSFAIQMLMLVAHQLMEKQNLGMEVNVLVEEGHRHSQQMLQILQRIKRAHETGSSDPALHILSAGLGSKKDHPILQAADMLAYSDWQKLQHWQGLSRSREIYDALHVKGSRYQAGYVDLDDRLLPDALEVAKKSDIAKALLKKAWYYQNKADKSDPRTVKGIDEINRGIREFRQKYEEADPGLTRGTSGETESGTERETKAEN